MQATVQTNVAISKSTGWLSDGFSWTVTNLLLVTLRCECQLYYRQSLCAATETVIDGGQ